MMRHYVADDGELADRYRACEAFRSDAAVREAIQLGLAHDVELQSVLGEHYDLYHFREDPDVEGFYDFRLRKGASTARNAIRLLERTGFPPEIVARAMEYARRGNATDT